VVGVISKAVLVAIGCLVLGDIAGVVILTVIDVIGLAYNSAGLAYAVWFVFGAFAGFFSYNLAGSWCVGSAARGKDWTSLPTAKPTGSIVVLAQIALVLSLCGLFYLTMWNRPVAGEYYVPDSMTHSLTYFVAVVGAILLARFALMPTPDTRSG
jgi:hypothetical protein